MAQFLGDIAFLLELGLVAAGLVLLHVGRERSGALLRSAGWILAVGASATALCTGYFWFRYHRAGDFDRAGPAAAVEKPSSNLGSLDINALSRSHHVEVPGSCCRRSLLYPA